MAPSPRRPRPPLPKRVAAAALNQLPLKLAALFFSFVLWLAVSAEEPTDEWVPVRVSVATDSTVSLREPVPAVRAFVIGRGRELLKLYVSEPTVHRTIGGDNVADSVTIALKPSDVTLPAWVDADVREIEPSSITLRFAVTQTRTVPIRSELRLHADSGWRIVGDPTFAPESVTVSGPRKEVRRIRAVPTVKQELAVRDSVPRAVPLDTAGLHVLVQPAVVRVLVPAVPEAPPVPVDSTAPAASPSKPASKSKGARPRHGTPRQPAGRSSP